jgi:hypothetical protein
MVEGKENQGEVERFSEGRIRLQPSIYIKDNENGLAAPLAGDGS